MLSNKDMNRRRLPPLKKYKILTHLLNNDKEVYTSYETDRMPFAIIFDDLVQTLKINPKRYNRPIVELEDYGFLVRGNNVFYEAGIEAGLTSFECDVNINALNDRHMSQFQLLDIDPEKEAYKLHSVFFAEKDNSEFFKPESIEKFIEHLNNSLRIVGISEHISFEHNTLNALELKISHALKDEEYQINYAKAKKILENNITIRSENGLVKK
jgi:hypothetical protein